MGIFSMTINQLNTFLSVCECMSFTEAASRLFITQSAVSRQMTALESELNARLFNRIRNTVLLTESGRYLYQELPAVLEQLKNICENSQNIGDGIDGNLQIGLQEDQRLDEDVCEGMHYLSKNGKVNMSVRQMDFRSMYAAIRNRSIDIAICIFQVSGTFEDCAYHIYSWEPMYLTAANQLLPDSQSPLSPEELREYMGKHRIISPSMDNFLSVQYPYLEQFRVIEDWAGTTVLDDNVSAIVPMVTARLAATIVNKSHILSTNRNISMRELPFLPSVGKGMYWLSDNKNPLIGRLMEQLGS